jgi:hypothetical protein
MSVLCVQRMMRRTHSCGESFDLLRVGLKNKNARAPLENMPKVPVNNKI